MPPVISLIISARNPAESPQQTLGNVLTHQMAQQASHEVLHQAGSTGQIAGAGPRGPRRRSWRVDHNRLMMYRACKGTAEAKGWDYVRAFPWWPEVEVIAFHEEKPWR